MRETGVTFRSLITAFAYRQFPIIPKKQKKEGTLVPSGAKEDRTPDPLLAKQVLSQLSYNPMYIESEAIKWA